MMFEPNEVTMVVTPLASGRFAVSRIRRNALNKRLGEFDSRSEAEAWILQHSMAGDEVASAPASSAPGIVRSSREAPLTGRRCGQAARDGFLGNRGSIAPNGGTRLRTAG